MATGPKNFLHRVKQELNKYDLPQYTIINPSPDNISVLDRLDILKIGRLDGVIYYKVTAENLYNLIKQRRDKRVELIKYIPTFLTMFLNKPLNNHLNRLNIRVMKKSDAIVFQSKLSKQMHQTFIGEVNKPNTIILNGVPTDIYNPNIEKLNLEGFPKLVITASFRLHKRLQDAIAITNFLKKKYKNIRLHILGSMDSLTQECINKIDVSNCTFHGVINSNELPGFYNSCDIGLSPSIFDPCPNSTVEMMGCGLPVISVEESGASELIACNDLIIKENLKLDFYELQTANKIPKVNVSIWANMIEKVLDNKIYYSEAMLQRIEEELDIKIVAKKYANFIKENKNAIS